MGEEGGGKDGRTGEFHEDAGPQIRREHGIKERSAKRKGDGPSTPRKKGNGKQPKKTSREITKKLTNSSEEKGNFSLTAIGRLGKI